MDIGPAVERFMHEGRVVADIGTDIEYDHLSPRCGPGDLLQHISLTAFAHVGAATDVHAAQGKLMQDCEKRLQTQAAEERAFCQLFKCARKHHFA
ncbi:MAG: hypothetical protein M3041_03720 [Acidobacteriota bacterium]|nr:hypothetical protein [Acidobacteriota bacterium]